MKDGYIRAAAMTPKIKVADCRYNTEQIKELITKAYDNKAAEPIFVEVRYDFIQKFSRRLIQNPEKRIMIGITGESASGKSTICKEIQNRRSLSTPH